MLEGLKVQAFEANLLLPGYRLVYLTFGNVSVIDRRHGILAIKPSGVSYEVLTAEDMVLVDIEGHKAVENAFALGLLAEMAIHTRQLNPDINAIETCLLDKHFWRKHGANAYYGQGS